MYTVDNLNKIEEAILKLQSGERVVQVAHEGYSVKYAEVDLSDLIKLRDKIKSETLPRKSKLIQIISHKGI